MPEPAAPQWQARLPWIGPVVGAVTQGAAAAAGARLDIRVSLRADPTQAEVARVLMVPVVRQPGGWQRRSMFEYRLLYGHDLPAPPAPTTEAHGPDVRTRLEAGAFPVQIPTAWVGGDGDRGVLFLTVDQQSRRRAPGVHRPIDFFAAGGKLQPKRLKHLESLSLDGSNTKVWKAWEQSLSAEERAQLADEQTALGAYFAALPADVERGILQLSAHVLAGLPRAAAGLTPPPGPLTFALGSCQYPAGLLDREVAQASYRRLGALIDPPRPLPSGATAPPTAALPAPQFLLLLGDQVYLDETAGVFDPTPGINGIDRAYERNVGLPAFRSVTRRLPTFMMPDDHEVQNDWQPPADSPYTAHAVARGRAWQTSLNPRRPTAPDERSFTMAPAGWPMFVLDTRYTREPRTARHLRTARLIPARVMDSVIAWLKTQQAAHPSGPKFIASPSVLLPFERQLNPYPATAQNAGAGAGAGAGAPVIRLGGDGWSGYPASMQALLHAIWDHGIQNVVFLAGDAHLTMNGVCTLSSRKGQPLSLYGVVSSGLYAPWRFSNADAGDFVTQGTVSLDLGDAPPVTAQVQTEVWTGNGFATVSVARDATSGTCTLRIDVHHASGHDVRTHVLPQPTD